MHGLNKDFMKHPYEFLRNHPVRVEMREATETKGTVVGPPFAKSAKVGRPP